LELVIIIMFVLVLMVNGICAAFQRKELRHITTSFGMRENMPNKIKTKKKVYSYYLGNLESLYPFADVAEWVVAGEYKRLEAIDDFVNLIEKEKAKAFDSFKFMNGSEEALNIHYKLASEYNGYHEPRTYTIEVYYEIPLTDKEIERKNKQALAKKKSAQEKAKLKEEQELQLLEKLKKKYGV